MEKYISIPSTRFMELVQKYIDFKQRKVILGKLLNKKRNKNNTLFTAFNIRIIVSI